MRFDILLDNPSHSYYPGQVVSGRVLVDCEESVTILALQIKFIGGAGVCFDPSVGEGSCVASENYVNYKLHLGTEGGPYFPFSFHLPMQIPCTFGQPGSECFVQYNLIATVQRSWRLDSEHKIPITVLGIYDLNYFPGLLNSVQIREEKCLGVLFLKSGPFGFTLRLSKTGFVPGEFVDFVAEIYNKSSKPVPKTSIKLIQITTSKGRMNRRTNVCTNRHVSTIVKMEGPAIPVGDSYTWRGERKLQVPNLPPTDLGGFCRIIKVSYFLEMKVNAPYGDDVTGQFPIAIGTVPLQLNNPEFQVQQAQNYRSVGMTNQWHPQYPPQAVPGPSALDLPPSYSSVWK